ncbi:MAG TPA: hypothetical protein VIR04_03930, partial [Paralcaligenes sp.]
MATKEKETGIGSSRGAFILEGSIALQESEGEDQDLGVKVFAFDRLGEPLGGGEPDGKGNFRLTLRLAAPADIQIMAG